MEGKILFGAAKMLHLAVGEDCQGIYMMLSGALLSHYIYIRWPYGGLRNREMRAMTWKADDGATQTLVAVSKASHSLHVSP